MRRPLRIVLLVTLVALLTMHGLDATATASHRADDRHHAAAIATVLDSGHRHGTSAPEHEHGRASAAGVTAPERTDAATDGRSTGGLGGGLHDAAAACMVAVVTAVAFGARRLSGAQRHHAPRAVSATADLGRRMAAGSDDLVPHPPPPAWLRLCVIRH